MCTPSLDLAYELQVEYGWASSFAAGATHEYDLWLRLRAKACDFELCKFPPSRVVAMVWNLHRQWTLDYANTCLTLGGFIHHYPPAMRINVAMEQAYSSTVHLYCAEYKQNPPPQYWGPSIADAVKTCDAVQNGRSNLSTTPILDLLEGANTASSRIVRSKKRTPNLDTPILAKSPVQQSIAAGAPRANLKSISPRKQVRPNRSPGKIKGFVLRPLAPGEKRRRGRPSIKEYVQVSDLKPGALATPIKKNRGRPKKSNEISQTISNINQNDVNQNDVIQAAQVIAPRPLSPVSPDPPAPGMSAAQVILSPGAQPISHVGPTVSNALATPNTHSPMIEAQGCVQPVTIVTGRPSDFPVPQPLPLQQSHAPAIKNSVTPASNVEAPSIHQPLSMVPSQSTLQSATQSTPQSAPQVDRPLSSETKNPAVLNSNITNSPASSHPNPTSNLSSNPPSNLLSNPPSTLPADKGARQPTSVCGSQLISAQVPRPAVQSTTQTAPPLNSALPVGDGNPRSFSSSAQQMPPPTAATMSTRDAGIVSSQNNQAVSKRVTMLPKAPVHNFDGGSKFDIVIRSTASSGTLTPLGLNVIPLKRARGRPRKDGSLSKPQNLVNHAVMPKSSDVQLETIVRQSVAVGPGPNMNDDTNGCSSFSPVFVGVAVPPMNGDHRSGSTERAAGDAASAAAAAMDAARSSVMNESTERGEPDVIVSAEVVMAEAESATVLPADPTVNDMMDPPLPTPGISDVMPAANM